MVYLLRQEKGNSARGKVVGQDGKGEVLQFGMCRRGKRELVSCLKVIRANDKGWLCSRGECGRGAMWKRVEDKMGRLCRRVKNPASLEEAGQETVPRMRGDGFLPLLDQTQFLQTVWIYSAWEELR